MTVISVSICHGNQFLLLIIHRPLLLFLIVISVTSKTVVILYVISSSFLMHAKYNTAEQTLLDLFLLIFHVLEILEVF
jgi:hypothetical protein